MKSILIERKQYLKRKNIKKKKQYKKEKQYKKHKKYKKEKQYKKHYYIITNFVNKNEKIIEKTNAALPQKPTPAFL